MVLNLKIVKYFSHKAKTGVITDGYNKPEDKTMNHVCIDGNGNKIEISLAELLHVSDVAAENGLHKFIVTYQAKAKSIEVGGFKSRLDAVREKERLDSTKQDDINR